jgi:hypothetical protein
VTAAMEEKFQVLGSAANLHHAARYLQLFFM